MAVATVLFAVAQLGSSQPDAKFLFANPQSCEYETPSGRRGVTLCTGIRYSFISGIGQRVSETQASSSGESVELRIANNADGFLSVWEIWTDGGRQLTPFDQYLGE